MGDAPALLTADGSITYRELADRVATAGDRLGPQRRLVALAGRNHPDALVYYLAALRGSHPLLLVDARHGEAMRRLADVYDPDVVIRPGADGSDAWEVDERRRQSSHILHPDLALLLSTSGSTGSPKLVRLSRANLDANAEAIASYLEIRATDRAVTSLPLAYCYGLSVINSHLTRGASVVLTDRSVIDQEFWELLSRTRATSFAGVPYTFDLLDRVGFADMSLPHLRYITQAGGRLEPATVRRYAELGQRDGWQLFVMYGQTEATARMAYLPAALASVRPDSIGVPIPGGALRLDPLPDAEPDVGELVYTGPNVMLGYAEAPADLALGRSISELRTGDLGRRGDDGLLEIIGRRSEHLKIVGHRVDPRALEDLVERQGAHACAVGTDDELVVFTEPGGPSDLEARIRRTLPLPAHAVRVATLSELPRLGNGKVDREAMRRLAATRPVAQPTAEAGDAPAGIRELYAATFRRDDISDEDSFSSLGGDSLSYVEITLGLEDIIGRLPDRWASMPVRELCALAARDAGAPRPSARFASWRSIEMTVALRAAAIVLIVATHIGMTLVPGGAHVLMAVAGFNFARFRLTPAGRSERVRSQLRAIARIALPAMAWVGAAMLLLDQYDLRHVLLVNALVHDEQWGNLWFIELLVYIGLLMAALSAVPALDRAERRWPFAAALAILGAALLFRFGAVDFGIPYTKPVLWLFALGWAANRAEGRWQRAIVAAVAAASIPGYFDAWERNAVILIGILLLIGVPRVRIPRFVAPVAGMLASASLYIYLVHWEVWPMFEGWYGVPSLLASLAAGIALWLAAAMAPRLIAAVPRYVKAWTAHRAPMSPHAGARPPT